MFSQICLFLPYFTVTRTVYGKNWKKLFQLILMSSPNYFLDKQGNENRPRKLKQRISQKRYKNSFDQRYTNAKVLLANKDF